MFGNIMGALFFVVVAFLPRGRRIEVCAIDEGGTLPYIWDRCEKPCLFRGQRPTNNNIIWGVTYPATYVKGEKFPFIGEDLGVWRDRQFVELCQFSSPANCIVPPPCTSVRMLCVLFPATMDEELPIVGFFARMGCEEADEQEEQPKLISSHRASLLVTHEWDHCRHCRRGRQHTGMNRNRMARDRARQSARRIKAEVQGY